MPAMKAFFPAGTCNINVRILSISDVVKSGTTVAAASLTPQINGQATRSSAIAGSGDDAGITGAHGNCALRGEHGALAGAQDRSGGSLGDADLRNLACVQGTNDSLGAADSLGCHDSMRSNNEE